MALKVRGLLEAKGTYAEMEVNKKKDIRLCLMGISPYRNFYELQQKNIVRAHTTPFFI